MIQQKTALEKQRRAGIVALALQGKQGGHGVERTVDDPGCFFEKSIIQPPWPKRKPLLRRLFRGKRKGTGWLSLHPIRTFQFNKKSDPSKVGSLFGGKRGIHSVTLRLKTVHRTVFTAESPLLLPAHSNPSLSNSIKKVTPLCGITFFGGKRGIRTLGAFIGHTRFPVVRLRPAQPSFHNGFCCVHSTRKCLIIISGRSKKVKHFLEKNGEIFRRVDGQPKV